MEEVIEIVDAIGTGMMKRSAVRVGQERLGQKIFSLKLNEEFQGPQEKTLGLPQVGIARSW